MSASARTVAAPVGSVRRARVMGIFFLLIAALVLIAFGIGSHSGLQSRLGLSPARGETFFRFPDLVVPSRGTSMLIAAVCGFLGGGGPVPARCTDHVEAGRSDPVELPAGVGNDRRRNGSELGDRSRTDRLRGRHRRPCRQAEHR